MRFDGNTICKHSEDVGIMCSSESSGTVRLRQELLFQWQETLIEYDRSSAFLGGYKFWAKIEVFWSVKKFPYDARQKG